MIFSTARARNPWRPLLGVAMTLGVFSVLGLLLGVGCMSDSKESVIRETLDCQAQRDPFFEQGLMMMFPTAEDLDDAKDQYVYVSQAASLDDLKAARDEMCGGSGGYSRLMLSTG